MQLSSEIINRPIELYACYVNGTPILLQYYSPVASYRTARMVEGLLVSDFDLILKLVGSIINWVSFYKLVKFYDGTYYLTPIDRHGNTIPGGFNIKLLEVKYV